MLTFFCLLAQLTMLISFTIVSQAEILHMMPIISQIRRRHIIAILSGWTIALYEGELFIKQIHTRCEVAFMTTPTVCNDVFFSQLIRVPISAFLIEMTNICEVFTLLLFASIVSHALHALHAYFVFVSEMSSSERPGYCVVNDTLHQ